MVKKLPIETQIAILSNIDFEKIEDYGEGLCTGIRISILKLNLEKECGFTTNTSPEEVFSLLSVLIPLFTLENARLHADATTDNPKHYWWYTSTNEGYDKRRLFIDWIISELKKQNHE